MVLKVAGGGGGGAGSVTIIGGTANQINVSPNPITSTGNIALANITTAGTFGNASTVSQVVIDATGRVTSATNVAISIANSAITGLGTMATQNANAVAITGGTINSVVHTGGTFDNVTIGATTANTGRFTVLTVTSSSTLGNATANQLNNTPIGNNQPNTGAFTSLSATSANLANANISSVLVTFPNSFLANSTTTLGNATLTLGGTTSSVGNLTLSNVTITSGSIPNSAITGLGTMAYQNANAVAITGGNINVTYANATYHIATANTLASGNAGAFSLGVNSFNDTGVLTNFTTSNNSYVQVTVQNTSNGNAASAEFIAYNDQGTAATNFATVGINSSTYNGVGSINAPGYGYFISGSTDLVLGTIGSNKIHFVANSAATDAMVVNANNTVNITTLTGSNANITQVTATNGIFFNANIVSANATVGVGYNAMSAGNVSVANAVTVTVSAGSRWVIV